MGLICCRTGGHNGGRVAFSPDGRLIATSGAGGAARIWDVESGALVLTLQTSGFMLSDIAFSPDGRLIATADDHSYVSIWDARTGQRVRRIVVTSRLDRLLGRRPHGYPRNWTSAVAFSPDGALLAAGTSDAAAGVWKVETGQHVAVIDGHANDIADIVFSPDSTHVATISSDRTARVWDLTP